MKDFQSIYLNELAKVDKLELMGFEYTKEHFVLQDYSEVYCLEVTGRRLSRAKKVLTDGTIRNFSIINDTKLAILMPIKITNVDEVFIITDANRFTNNSMMSYELTNTPGFTSGKQRVIFQFVKCLLTTKKTDLFNPNIGGGLQNKLLEPYAASNPQYPATTIAFLVTEEAIRYINNQSKRLKKEDRVQSIVVESAGIDPTDPTSIIVQLRFSFFDNTQELLGFMVNSQLAELGIDAQVNI